jgi:transcriptional regulator with XRE-family HTH domain
MGKARSGRVEMTPEQRAEHAAIRERFRRERPGLDELVAKGEVDEPVPQGQFLELSVLVDRIRRERELQGLSLADVSDKSGITRQAISRIENGWNFNPTLDTLYRYASAMGLHIRLAAEPVDDTVTLEGEAIASRPQACGTEGNEALVESQRGTAVRPSNETVDIIPTAPPSRRPRSR